MSYEDKDPLATEVPPSLGAIASGSGPRVVEAPSILLDPTMAANDDNDHSHMGEDIDDDDEDNWSRQVEMDETVGGGMEESFRGAHSSGPQVTEEHDVSSGKGGDDDEDMIQSTGSGSGGGGGPTMIPLVPSQPELTMREKLVNRERQRRIETERARLKRQFALNNNIIGDRSHGDQQGGGNNTRARSTETEIEELAIQEKSSVAGTLGEGSMCANPDEDIDDTLDPLHRHESMFNSELQSKMDEPQGPVMERFLNEPMVVMSNIVDEPPVTDDATSLTTRSVTFDAQESTLPQTVEHDVAFGTPGRAPVVDFLQSMNESVVSADANISVQVEADDDEFVRDPLSTPMPSMDAQDDYEPSTPGVDEPRVLRLTEADMQEMAAIEEASIGNAPPSDREEEDLSEIGELVDFGGPNIHDTGGGSFSQETPTTAMESASILSGNQSALHPTSDEQFPHSVDGLHSASVSSQHLLSPAESVNDTAAAHHRGESAGGDIMPAVVGEEIERLADTTGHDDQTAPMMLNRLRSTDPVSRHSPRQDVGGGQFGSLLTGSHDFDTNDPLNDKPWSPLEKLSASMITQANLSRLSSRTAGTLTSTARSPHESTPLLDIPNVIVTRQHESDEENMRHSRRSSIFSSWGQPRTSLRSTLDSVFSDIRSEEDYEIVEIENDAQLYRKSSILGRAFPERMIALLVTLLFEIPVLLMISGGSDSLCFLLGRRRYQLLMGFIPLTSAISGNVGLQASTLTTRAISHTHVTTESYRPWLQAEVGAAACLGLGMGTVLGTLAFVASGMDFPFALTILAAQFISIVTAGMTGTFAPLLFSLIFKRDSGKWGGPLETAIQDIVGSFAMVVISYHLLKWFGAGGIIDPSDMCGASA